MATKETKAARLLAASSESKLSSGAGSGKAETKMPDHEDEQRRKQQIESDLQARVAKLEEKAATEAEAAAEAKSPSAASNAAAAAGTSDAARDEGKEPSTADTNLSSVDEKSGAGTPSETSIASTSAASTGSQPAAATSKMTTLYEKQQKALGDAKRSFLSAAMRRSMCQRVVASLFSRPSPPMSLGNGTAAAAAAANLPTTNSKARAHVESFFTATVPARCFRDLEVLVLDGTSRNVVVSIGSNNVLATASAPETEEDLIRLGDELCEIDGVSLEPLAQQEVTALAARVGRGARSVKVKRRISSGRSRGADTSDGNSSEAAKSVVNDVIWNFAFQHLIDDLLAQSIALVFPSQRIPDLELHERAKASLKDFQLACRRVNILVAAFAAAARHAVQISLPQLRYLPAGERVRTSSGAQSNSFGPTFVVCALGQVAEVSTLGAQASPQSMDGFAFQQSGAAAAEELRGSIRMCEALIYCAIHQHLKMLHARHSSSSPKSSGKRSSGDPSSALGLRLPLQCLVRVQGLAFGVEALSIEGDVHSGGARGPPSSFGFFDSPDVSSWGVHNRASAKDLQQASAVFQALYSDCPQESAVEDSLGFLLDFDGEANPMPR